MGEDLSTGSNPDAGPGAGAGASDADRKLTVEFRPDLIESWLASGVGPPLLAELGDQIVASGLTLRQVHPGTTDPQLASWFEVIAPDSTEAKRAQAFLSGHPAVVAAFIKPPDAPPG
jgi:hypothetical protein